MKLLFRAAAALALLGLASPAFPCGEKKTTTAMATATDAKAKTTAVAKAEKKAQPKAAQTHSEKPAKATN